MYPLYGERCDKRGVSELLVFEKSFYCDRGFGCLIWADDEKKRIRFEIGEKILQDVLLGRESVREDARLALCEKERQQIERACRNAYAKRPSPFVVLDPTDFH